ncbi:hypothetical protein [Nocardioides daejeonensis]|uniref:hypothetical protein n=1 Tax=Nocardioides daejeonensis TaxID=1046556 RepID=UPI000D747A88|nr:hypothetical protein [Nocardioides daejeonensis]
MGEWERLFEALVRHEAEALGEPHVVVCQDVETGRTTHHGPYPDALAALSAAGERETAARELGDNAEVVCRVARLWAPQPGNATLTRPQDRTEG